MKLAFGADRCSVRVTGHFPTPGRCIPTPAKLAELGLSFCEQS